MAAEDRQPTDSPGTLSIRQSARMGAKMEDAEIRKEFYTLAAEPMAIQTIIVNVLGRIGDADPRLRDAIRAGFDDAASQIESLAIKLGKASSPDHAVKALGIVEQLRAATISDHDKPRHGV